MALQKQTVNVNFAQGIQTKSDPFQLSLGRFENLENSVFDTVGLLKKRNGFGLLNTFSGSSTLTTYNGSLVAIGNTLQSYVARNNTLINSGIFQPIDLSTKSLVRRATSQTTVDVAVASNGLACSVWLDQNANSYYQISDSSNSQIVIPAVQLPATATMPRVYVLGRYFLITFGATVAAAPHLQYIAIPIQNPSNPGIATDIATTISSITAAYDAIVYNDTLYISWNGNDGGGAIRSVYITNTLNASAAVTIAGQSADYISVTADASNSTIWVSFYKLGTNTIKTKAYNSTLIAITGTVTAVSSITINELTASATAGVLTLFYEVANTYSYTPNAKSDYISKNTVTIGSVVGTPAVVLRGVGLASKAFYFSPNSLAYVLVTYGQAYQPTYFLIDQAGNVVSKLAYSNGRGYMINQILSNVNIDGESVSIGYLFTDLLAAVNKTQGDATPSGVYTQLGINLATFTFSSLVQTSDIAKALHIDGGMLWMYDGVKAVEHGFHVWPEDLAVQGHATGGSMVDGTYYYIATYEWTDNQGNIHRSAPSVPLVSVLNGGGSSESATVNIPYLRQTYKISNKVRIVLYRWSTVQQTYYRVTSITSPQLNDPTADSLAYLDTQPDSAIAGNDILYTTGGIIENIAAPACSSMTLSGTRLFIVDAEDRNLIWYSKQVVEATPVEMSDLFTIYIPPTIGAQASTGDITALFSMDDKLIIFKNNAIYYITGNGPDNTGANNDFSQPVFITSTVGCNNSKSIVFTPKGLVFQSSKGLWLLDRNLSTSYIGADVEVYNQYEVTSAVAVPGTNQVRLTLNTNIFLMYDYYVEQWGTFNGLSAISSVIFEDLHTYLNSSGQFFQETVGMYMDNSNPVLLSFTTNWINLAGLQGFQRSYFFYLLGVYYSPHKLTLQTAYDYNPSPSQSTVFTPSNYSGTYGSDPLYGSSSVMGGATNVEQCREFFEQGKCQSFQITVTESFDASFGTNPGAGFTLSGLDLVVGLKDGKPKLPASQSVG